MVDKLDIQKTHDGFMPRYDMNGSKQNSKVHVLHFLRWPRTRNRQSWNLVLDLRNKPEQLKSQFSFACFHLRGLWVTVSGNFVLQTPQAQQCNGANKVTRSFLWVFFGWKAHWVRVFGRMKSIALMTPRTFVPKLSRLSKKLWNSGTPGWRRLGKRATDINW